MALDYYIHSGGKRLRCGFTTGTCAALAAAGAVAGLLTGELPDHMSLVTPAGVSVEVPLVRVKSGVSSVCGVRKDAGDDRDATDGILIVAEASRGKDERSENTITSCGNDCGSNDAEGPWANQPIQRISAGSEFRSKAVRVSDASQSRVLTSPSVLRQSTALPAE